MEITLRNYVVSKSKCDCGYKIRSLEKLVVSARVNLGLPRLSEKEDEMSQMTKRFTKTHVLMGGCGRIEDLGTLIAATTSG